jgi:hypothetical protein
MRLTTALICSAVLATGCSRQEEDTRPALDRAEERLQASLDTAEAKLAEGTAEAKKALDAAMKRWDELRPEAEQAIQSLEDRVEKLVNDSETLRRLPPDVLERIQAHLAAMRERLAEANAAHEQGDTELAVEKADAVQQERAAVEDLLVERPDPPKASR